MRLNGDKMTEPTPANKSLSQTLSRGLQIIEILSESRAPLTAAELAARLGVNRAIAYRLLRTLSKHGLLDEGERDGRYRLGTKLLTLARNVDSDVREAAAPILDELSSLVGATVFVSVADGNEFVALVSAEAVDSLVSLRYRAGIRRPLGKGATSVAIAASLPPRESDSAEVIATRERGYVHSAAGLDTNAYTVAAPLSLRAHPQGAALTAIFPTVSIDAPDLVGAAIANGARRIAAATP